MAEDLAADAVLIWRALQRAGLNCDVHRVDTGIDFRRELEEFKPDVILSDFTMPSFSGMEALEIARLALPGIPFIFVSGTLGEENAIRALKYGATDYILKSNLLRLPAAVERAIKEVRERRVRQEFERDLRDSERRYRKIFQTLPHPAWIYDSASLRFLIVNDAAVARYGFSRDEFLGMTINDLLSGNEHPGSAGDAEVHLTKSGKLIHVTVASADIELDDRVVRIAVATLIA